MLTQARLKEFLHYEPETGIFTWINSSRRGWNGKEAGYPHGDGYIAIEVRRVKYLAHRLAYLYMEGFMPEFVDHDNLIKSDNKWVNLRSATKCENGYNRAKLPNNTSGVPGVSFHTPTSKWAAFIGYQGKRINLGRHASKEEAAEAVRVKRIELHGEFANHG